MVIAYCPCLEHGYQGGLTESSRAEAIAVDTGAGAGREDIDDEIDVVYGTRGRGGGDYVFDVDRRY